jgi:hypothetical protein
MGAPAPDEREAVRDALVESLERQLPNARVEMVAIVAVTGLVGFGVSAGLLHAGLSSMARRYSVATVAAYGVFLLVVRLWAERRRRELAWTPPYEALRARAPQPDLSRPEEEWWNGLSPFGRVYTVRHLLSLVIPLAMVAVMCGWLVALAWVVWTAPALLAEVLLDVALVAGLYRSLRSLEPHSWLRTVIRRTWKPAVVVVVVLAGFGWVAQTALPEVDSIGDLLRP